MKVPNELDGAKVLYYTLNEKINDFGIVTFNGEDITITNLVIAQYDQDERFYLFACDLNWQVIGDTLHDSVEEAMSFAQEYYDVESIAWESSTQG